VFCDLWRRTLDGPTPPGAIPAQIEHALDAAGPVPAGAAVKLYNASNFFDPRAVPPSDDAAIAALVEAFSRVVVESHPRLVGPRCAAFGARLHGTLEVAIGLETANADVLARLDKSMTLKDFDRAAFRLAAEGAALRVFLLVPPPFLPPGDAVDSIAHSVTYAHARGARHISLIPTRHDKSTVVDRAATAPPGLGLISRPGTVVTVDLWDIDGFVTCEHCGPARVERLRHINSTGRAEPRVSCPLCTSPS
jgi:hypothetical protein